MHKLFIKFDNTDVSKQTILIFVSEWLDLLHSNADLYHKYVVLLIISYILSFLRVSFNQ